MLIKGFPLGVMAANCYLAETDDAVFVVDPSDYDVRIADFLRQSGDKEKFILLTHCHFDHIMGADRIRELFGAKIVIGEKDDAGLANASLNLSKLFGCDSKPFVADIKVTDKQVINIGKTKLEVIETPGHTAGSVCYKIEDVIFTGDTLFEGSVGRTDFPTGDFSALKESLEKLKKLAVLGDLTLYTGHGNKTTLSHEIKTNPYM